MNAILLNALVGTHYSNAVDILMLRYFAAITPWCCTAILGVSRLGMIYAATPTATRLSVPPYHSVGTLKQETKILCCNTGPHVMSVTRAI